MSWNVKCHEISNVMKCQMSWNVKCHEMSNVMKCHHHEMSNVMKFHHHEMSNVMKCQMSWNFKCHEVSNLMKCQRSLNVKRHQISNVKCNQMSNVKCNQMSNIVKFLMSVEVALCSGPCRVPLQWPPAAAPGYSREISQRLSTHCLSNLFKCHPSFISKQSF